MAVLILWSAVSNAQNISGLISRIGDTTHLEFRGQRQWVYDSPKRSGNSISVTLPAFDDQTVKALRSWHDSYIKRVTVNRNGPDGKYVLTFALNGPDVDVFDYLTDQPSALIFDFFKSTPKVAVTSSAKAKKRTVKLARMRKYRRRIRFARRHGRMDRSPASTEFMKMPKKQVTVTDLSGESADPAANIRFDQGVFDGADPNYDRFRIKSYQINENAIIASQQNIYIPFPMLPLRLKRFDELVNSPPVYEIKPDDDLAVAAQNKDARFLLFLFKEQHWGAFFKSYAYFEKKYPNSKYDEIVKNMAAEAHIHLYQKDGNRADRDAFQSLYAYLIDKYPNSVLAERNLLLLAYSRLQSDDGAEALRLLMLERQKYPDSPETDNVKMGIAEAQLLMENPKAAIETYDDIIKHPRNKNSAVEATYREGDVYFNQKQYQKALDAYEYAQKKYPSFNLVYPNAQYNASEAKFWLHNYLGSLNGFIDFVRLYPNHEYGGYALTRIGELLDILGAPQKRAVGAFTEAYFRYPDCPGSEVARIRMLSQGLKNMANRERRLALSEIDEIAAKSLLPRIDEFTTIVKAAGLTQAGEYQQSLNLLLSYYQSHPGTARLDVFRGRILRNISDVLKEKIDNHDFMDALNFYGKYSATWLKGSHRIDTKFFEAEAFEQAGVPAEAEREYKQILEKRKAIVGTNDEKERKVYEHLPSVAQIDLRLAAVTADQRRYQDAYSYLHDIKGELTPAQEIERVQLGATIAEQTGNRSEAIRDLEQLERAYAKDDAHAALMVKPNLQLARLYIADKKFDVADSALKRVEDLKQKRASDVTDEQWAKTLQLRGDLLLAEGQKLAAVEAYNKLLDSYEATQPLASIRYKAGKILFDQGDLEGAKKIWTGFEGDTGKFYQMLAQEKLQEAQWRGSYKKYIDRIPAAESLK